jgi:hypothetical protein
MLAFKSKKYIRYFLGLSAYALPTLRLPQMLTSVNVYLIDACHATPLPRVAPIHSDPTSLV